MHDNRIYLPPLRALDLSGDITAQTRQVLARADELLSAAGSERSQVLIGHLWLSDMSLFHAMTAVWNEWVDPAALPSRSCVSRTASHPAALVELDTVALLPSNNSLPIERYGIVSGPGRPRMCLALAQDDWFTACLAGPSSEADPRAQTQHILDQFEGFMDDAGVLEEDVLSLDVWLKHMSDFGDVKAMLVNWLAPTALPAATCMRADMARAECRVEIRMTARRRRWR